MTATEEAPSLEALYRDHARATFAFLTRIVGPTAEREDLVQETFVRLHHALPRFRGTCAVRTFVFRIATYVAIDYLRRVERRAARESHDEVEASDGAATPEARVSAGQSVASAVAMLARLSPKLRVAFVLREVLELTYEEIAEILECLPDAARMRVKAANRALEKELSR